MSPKDLISQARNRLNAPSTVTFPEAAMTQALNSALERWATDTLCITAMAHTDLVPGASSRYYYLSDLGPTARLLPQFRRVTIQMSPAQREETLEFIPYEELPDDYRNEPPNTPRFWSMLDSDTFMLYPAPATSVVGGLWIDAYSLPQVYVKDAVFASVEGDTNPLPGFRDTHREGLVRALMLELCEMGYEDPLFAARLPLAAANYAAEVERVRLGNRPMRPFRVGGSSRKGGGPAPYDRITGDRHSSRLLRW